MKLRRVVAAIFGLVLFTNGLHVALAQSIDGQRNEKIKSEVKKRLDDRKTGVKVEKFDGTLIKGEITRADDNTFTIIDSKTRQSHIVAFTDTKQIKGTGGWPMSAKIAIGVGVGLVITFVAFGLAYRNAKRNNLPF